MRVTTVVRRILGVTGLVVDGFAFEEDGLVVAARLRWRRPRCGECGKRAPGYDERSARRWRHLGLGALRVWLEYGPFWIDRHTQIKNGFRADVLYRDARVLL